MDSQARRFETPGEISVQDYVDLFTRDSVMVEFMKRYGPSQPVKLLKEGERYVTADCHQRAHMLGHAAFEAFGAAAVALSSHGCRAGPFHGAAEALLASRGTEYLEQDVATTSTPRAA